MKVWIAKVIMENNFVAFEMAEVCKHPLLDMTYSELEDATKIEVKKICSSLPSARTKPIRVSDTASTSKKYLILKILRYGKKHPSMR